MALPREIKPVRNENQSKESPIDDNPSEGRLSLVGEHSQPFLLCWSRLSKSVQISEKSSGLLNRSITVASENKKAPTRKQKKDPITKTILNQVSGQAVPGEILALMGPSGSGKTTLLDSLSGRTALNSGVITVNGNQIQSKEKSSALTQSMKRFNSKVAYVKQEDVFFDHLTVRDQLAYTAFLRMPQALSRQVKLDGVEGILKLLRLSKVANSPIKSLSGGEKKRVNIATELLTNPSCLLLDEPTSGLDSTSAVALVRLLQHLALQQQKTVIMSIHQPSSGIFLGFDSLLLLAEGSVVYFGSPTYSINYLAKKDLACPAGYNLADHWMDLLVSDSAIEEEKTLTEEASCTRVRLEKNESFRQLKERKNYSKDKPCRRSTRQLLIDTWDGESIAEQFDQNGQTLATNHSIRAEIALLDSSIQKYNTDWMTQYRILIHRALKNSRSAIFTAINMTRSALIGLVSGALWFQLDYTESTVQDRISYFFFTMTYWVFDSMFGAILAFPSERRVILKERASSSYHLSAYFMAKTTSEAPTRLTLPLICMSISFWMAGISDRIDLFAYTVLICLCSVLAGESYGLLIGASVNKVDVALTTATIVALFMMLLGGFYVQNVPSFISWARYLSPFKYAFDASRFLIFDKPVPCDGSGELQDLCNNGQEFATPEDVTNFLKINGSLGFNVRLLVLLGFLPRYLAYLMLKHRKGNMGRR